MASLRKKTSSKFWFACFTLPGGGRTQRSTKTTDRKLAQKLADEFEEAALNRRTESQARRVLSDLHHRISGKSLESPTIRKYLLGWIAARNGTVAAATQREYSAAVTEFLQFLGPGADGEISFLGTTEIATFRDQVGSRLSARTSNKKLKIIRVALQQAWRDGVIDQNPAAKVPILKSPAGGLERRAFTVAELRLLLGAADDEWKGLILFGLYTGQRIGDLVRLNWDNVEMATSTLKLTTLKTGRRQILPLAAPLRRWLGEKPTAKGPDRLFPIAAEVAERHGSVAMLSGQFRDLMAKAGLRPQSSHAKKTDGRGRSARRQMSELSFHSLRHTATSLMKNAGVSPALVQEFIGHDSKVISQNYTHIETEALRKAADALPDLLGD